LAKKRRAYEEKYREDHKDMTRKEPPPNKWKQELTAEEKLGLIDSLSVGDPGDPYKRF
jgi:hypothetical protein